MPADGSPNCSVPKPPEVDADRVVFTSGGTEANNLAVRGLAERRVGRVLRDPTSATAHLIISALEHPSIASLADELARRGWQIDRLSVDKNGVLRVDELQRLIRPETRAVAAMLGQNETGVLQPVAELAAICTAHNIPLHTDAAQVVGKLPVDFRGSAPRP